MPPIRPEQIKRAIPEIVFECFNSLIQLHFDGKSATVNQDEIVDLLVDAGFSRAEIDKKKLLDIELDYANAGWDVIYDKPGYNESGEAYYTFTKKRKKSKD